MHSLVYGCGAWGTTIAQLLAHKGCLVSLVCHDPKILKEINTLHTNTTYLPKRPILSDRIQAILEPEMFRLLPGISTIFLVVASPYYRQTLRSLMPILRADQIVVSATKGMEEKTHRSILEMATEELSEDVLQNRFVILSGPNLAGEIYLGKPAATVVACRNQATAQTIQMLISSPQFRAYYSDDLIGVEYGGILKNVIAIAAGILDALELGANAKAALLVRGIAEMKRFALSQGAREETLSGLSGFGDLITTCLGPQSRNYSVGFQIGKGETIQEIVSGMVAVAEGVKT
ncbi:MAG: NAD(P)H-dependent glycerol-3-phosphate dehydrogenase, partial [Candidatus Margulisiibacteriota bacterium]